jgi:hypothetical protein
MQTNLDDVLVFSFHNKWELNQWTWLWKLSSFAKGMESGGHFPALREMDNNYVETKLVTYIMATM